MTPIDAPEFNYLPVRLSLPMLEDYQTFDSPAIALVNAFWGRPLAIAFRAAVRTLVRATLNWRLFGTAGR